MRILSSWAHGPRLGEASRRVKLNRSGNPGATPAGPRCSATSSGEGFSPRCHGRPSSSSVADTAFRSPGRDRHRLPRNLAPRLTKIVLTAAVPHRPRAAGGCYRPAHDGRADGRGAPRVAPGPAPWWAPAVATHLPRARSRPSPEPPGVKRARPDRAWRAALPTTPRPALRPARRPHGLASPAAPGGNGWELEGRVRGRAGCRGQGPPHGQQTVRWGAAQAAAALSGLEERCGRRRECSAEGL
jgi:hypothetical protein